MTSTTRLARIDLAAGIGLAIICAIDAALGAREHAAAATILTAAAVLPIAWRRRRPLTVLTWLLGVFVFENLFVTSVQPFNTVLAAVAMAIYGGGAYTDGRRALAGLVIAAVGMGAIQATCSFHSIPKTCHVAVFSLAIRKLLGKPLSTSPRAPAGAARRYHG